MDSDRIIDTHAFLIGVPKAGTTWLANTLSQNPEICLSDPKEPNIITSHKGTFRRSTLEPNWSEYFQYFKGAGLKLDASIHTFSCPISAARISEKFENPKFILSLREPVSRSFSHWSMITDTGEDQKWGVDWSDFEVAWADARLKQESFYAESMIRWLEHFQLSDFFIFDSDRLRQAPEEVLAEIDKFLGLPRYEYSIDLVSHSNSAKRRRRITPFGKFIKTIFSLVPNFVKAPGVNYLRARDVNIYSLPILSGKRKTNERKKLSGFHYSICVEDICKDLEKFSKITNFSTNEWIKAISELAEK
jgi:hypothetical protein